MKVLITGANGFVGKNLAVHLGERKDLEVFCFCREHTARDLVALVAKVDFIFHLAGVNRPQDPEEFKTGNAGLTQALSDAIIASGRKIPLIYT
ncbi:capsular biosynthesis protein, partial [Pseudomonas aeruginosa]